MRDSKSNFQNVIRDYLDQLAEIDAEFAEKYRVKENQIEQCCAYIISEMHNLAQNNVIGVTDDEVYGLAIHYYLEDDLEVKYRCIFLHNREISLMHLKTRPIVMKIRVLTSIIIIFISAFFKHIIKIFGSRSLSFYYTEPFCLDSVRFKES